MSLKNAEGLIHGRRDEQSTEFTSSLRPGPTPKEAARLNSRLDQNWKLLDAYSLTNC